MSNQLSGAFGEFIVAIGYLWSETCVHHVSKKLGEIILSELRQLSTDLIIDEIGGNFLKFWQK